jgi:hypothetical protein
LKHFVALSLIIMLLHLSACSNEIDKNSMKDKQAQIPKEERKEELYQQISIIEEIEGFYFSNGDFLAGAGHISPDSTLAESISQQLISSLLNHFHSVQKVQNISKIDTPSFVGNLRSAKPTQNLILVGLDYKDTIRMDGMNIDSHYLVFDKDNVIRLYAEYQGSYLVKEIEADDETKQKWKEIIVSTINFVSQIMSNEAY